MFGETHILAEFAPWQTMVALALSIYAPSKLAMWLSERHRLTGWRAFAFLLAWPGMDPRPFAGGWHESTSQTRDWFLAFAKMAGGAAVLFLLVSYAAPASPRLAGLAGIAGLTLIFHCGLFHLAALTWQSLGVPVQPIMNSPLLATSLSDFWSRRWNLGFRDLAHRLVFRPLLARTNANTAMFGVFLFSGVVHDVVISVPAGAGYGLPTLYFLLQAVGLQLSRCTWFRDAALNRGWQGWTVTAAFVLVPIELLFHAPFCERVIVPMVAAINRL